MASSRGSAQVQNDLKHVCLLLALEKEPLGPEKGLQFGDVKPLQCLGSFHFEKNAVLRRMCSCNSAFTKQEVLFHPLDV